MFARKCLLNYAEDVTCFFKLKVCEQGILAVGKGPGGAKASDVRRRLSHWSTGRSKNLTTRQELTGFRMSRPLEASPAADRCMDDRLRLEDMDICSSSSSEEDLVLERALYSELRPLEYTSYGRTLQKSNNLIKKEREMLSVATFNVLSQSLLEMHRYLYKDCRSHDLKWSTRSSRLLRDFEFLKPDVFCLQEVEEDHLDEFFNKELERLGYKGIYKKRTHEKVDGCAIFFKTDKFDLIQYKTVELYKPDVQLLDRDNIGVIVELALKGQQRQHVVIATTHLLYTPRRHDIRLSQTQLMLAEIESLAFKDKDNYIPIIYTGDMNYTPDSAVYELVQEGHTQFYSHNVFPARFKGNWKSLLPKSVGITDSCQFASVLQERSEEYEPPTYESGSLGHQLNLDSVYGHIKDDLTEATTQQDRWKTVDYIFYSQKAPHSGRPHAELRLVSRLGLPNSEEAASDLGPMPNALCGSDHLPLMATFHLRS